VRRHAIRNQFGSGSAIGVCEESDMMSSFDESADNEIDYTFDPTI